MKTTQKDSEAVEFSNYKNMSRPLVWSSTDVGKFIGLCDDKLTTKYRGNKKWDQMSLIRTNKPISTSLSFYYFEIYISNSGKNGYIAIGLTTQVRNNRSGDDEHNSMPGFIPGSIGYFGDNGGIYRDSRKNNISLTDTYKTGDTIGCYVDIKHECCSFAINGKWLQIIDLNLGCNDDIFPTVGLNSPGAIITANFGQNTYTLNPAGKLCYFI